MSKVPLVGMNTLRRWKQAAEANDAYKRQIISYAAQAFDLFSEEEKPNWLQCFDLLVEGLNQGRFSGREETLVADLNAFLEKHEYEWVDLEDWGPNPKKQTKIPYVAAVGFQSALIFVGPFESSVQADEFFRELREFDVKTPPAVIVEWSRRALTSPVQFQNMVAKVKEYANTKNASSDESDS